MITQYKYRNRFKKVNRKVNTEAILFGYNSVGKVIPMEENNITIPNEIKMQKLQ